MSPWLKELRRREDRARESRLRVGHKSGFCGCADCYLKKSEEKKRKGRNDEGLNKN